MKEQELNPRHVPSTEAPGLPDSSMLSSLSASEILNEGAAEIEADRPIHENFTPTTTTSSDAQSQVMHRSKGTSLNRLISSVLSRSENEKDGVHGENLLEKRLAAQVSDRYGGKRLEVYGKCSLLPTQASTLPRSQTAKSV